jgi:hypothetical protein
MKKYHSIQTPWGGFEILFFQDCSTFTTMLVNQSSSSPLVDQSTQKFHFGVVFLP